MTFEREDEVVERFAFNSCEEAAWADDIGKLQASAEGDYVRYSDCEKTIAALKAKCEKAEQDLWKSQAAHGKMVADQFGMQDGALVRDLQVALTAAEAKCVELERERDRYRDGLRWYADGHHYDLGGWEDCSGESANWLFPPIREDLNAPAWMIDDGGIARSILDLGHRLNPNHAEEDEITIAPQPSDTQRET